MKSLELKARIAYQRRNQPLQGRYCRFDNDSVTLRKNHYLYGGSYIVALVGDNYNKSREGSNYRECVIQREKR